MAGCYESMFCRENHGVLTPPAEVSRLYLYWLNVKWRILWPLCYSISHFRGGRALRGVDELTYASPKWVSFMKGIIREIQEGPGGWLGYITSMLNKFGKDMDEINKQEARERREFETAKASYYRFRSGDARIAAKTREFYRRPERIFRYPFNLTAGKD